MYQDASFGEIKLTYVVTNIIIIEPANVCNNWNYRLNTSRCSRLRLLRDIPFARKFRFVFPEISSGEWNSILHNFRNRRQPRELYPNFQKFLTGNFRSIWFSSRNFRNFRLNGSLFGYSTISEFSENFSKKFPYHLSPFRNFRNFWLTGKRPNVIALNATNLSDLEAKICNGSQSNAGMRNVRTLRECVT